MYAAPITPGAIYQVKYRGQILNVLAAHGCDAICQVLRLLRG